MTSEASTTANPTVSVLSAAAIAFQTAKTQNYPSAEAVVNALLQAEKTAKQQRLTYPFESLVGQWRLCFVTGTQKARKRAGIVLGKGRYVPQWVKIHLSCQASTDLATAESHQGEIANQVQTGFLQLQLTGPLQYVSKKNLLGFDFVHLQVKLLGRPVYSGEIRGGQKPDFYTQSISQIPFFAFFCVTEDLIAARGRGGGLALWVKEPARDRENRT